MSRLPPRRREGRVHAQPPEPSRDLSAPIPTTPTKLRRVRVASNKTGFPGQFFCAGAAAGAGTAYAAGGHSAELDYTGPELAHSAELDYQSPV